MFGFIKLPFEKKVKTSMDAFMEAWANYYKKPFITDYPKTHSKWAILKTKARK